MIFIALTGLVWGFQWFAKSVYWTASRGEVWEQYAEPPSDLSSAKVLNPVDKIWMQMKEEHPNAEIIDIHFPHDSSASILASINPDASSYWKTDYRFFDQYSLKELSVTHIWGRFHEASNADRLMRMNYDIHVGAIGGLPGKFIAFFASLIVASLPVTGFIIWYGRRKKKTKPLIRSEQTPEVSQVLNKAV